MSPISSIGITNAAILTIAVDDSTVQRILDAAETMPWVLHNADFSAYVSSSRRPHIPQEIKNADVVIAVIDYSKNADHAAVSTAYLQQLLGNVIVIALATDRNPDLILQAMRAGCTEFVTNSTTQQEFAELLNRLNAQRNVSGARFGNSGSVLSFFGAKGGVGSTTLAVHLAFYLASYHNKKTLLIDNHTELGHACVYLGLDGAKSNFSELVKNVNRLDSDLLHGFTAKHHSGLEVLSSPDICGTARPIDADAVAKLLEFLKSEYDYIVIDSPNILNETNLAIVEGSTQIYLVATPEIGAIRDLSRCVDNLMQTHCAPEKLHVIINRFSSRFAVKVEQIEKAVRLPVAMRLPNSYVELVRSVNLGEPVALNAKSEFAMQISKWASTLAGTVTQTQSSVPPGGSPVEEKKASSIFAFFSF
ncbi:MAG TPA: AAA family ATPase [Acidobacteriaceae bacterium]|nr:AAA family ATPase [Acidobacteriaceae bacterium]